MKEKEKQLFKALCKFKSRFSDPTLLEFATPAVLGHLFFNRMQGVAYNVLKKNGFLGRVNREFRNSLGAAYDQNCQKNESFQKCIGMLKGAYLCTIRTGTEPRMMQTCLSTRRTLPQSAICFPLPVFDRATSETANLSPPQGRRSLNPKCCGAKPFLTSKR